MRTKILLLAVVMVLAFVFAGSAAAAPGEKACWGQASKVFAQLEPGTMGDHSSSYDTPRLGLRNLARDLYEDGVIEDDTMQALGKFVVSELGLDIKACD